MHWHLYRSTPAGRRWRNNVLTYWPIPENAGIDDSVKALYRLADEYKGLRTYYPVAAGRVPVQVVVPEFAVPVVRCDVAGAPDEQAAAEAFVGRVLQRDLDLDVTPPIRAVLVVSGVRPRWLALIIHHISIDGTARQVLERSYGRHLAAVLRGAPAPMPRLTGPLADAALQAAPSGRRQSGASLRRWAAVAASMPTTTLPVAAGPVPGPLPTEGLLSSPGAAACERLARQWEVPVSAVFLGAYAAVLGRFLDNTRTAVNVYSSNRFSPDQADSVGCLYQTIPVVIENGLDEPVRTFMQRAQKALLDTYRFGRYDFDDFTDGRVREQFRSGRNVSVMPSFNFTSGGAPAGDGSVSSAGWSVTAIEHDLGDPFEFVVSVAGPEVRSAVRFDAALVEPETATGLISAVHRFLEVAAAHPGHTVGELLDAADTPILKRGTDWVRRDGSWIHLDALVDAATRHPAVTAAEVEVERDGSLTLHVAARPGLTAFGLRCHLAGALTALPGGVVPDMFVVTRAGDPAAPATRSDGREPDRRPFDTVRELAVEAALGRIRPDITWTASEPYLLQGGRTADVTRVLAELADAGLGGLTCTDLMGFRPLADLAEAAVVLRPEEAVRPLDHRRVRDAGHRSAPADVI
ncbi:hypothetical protein Q0Z83_064680 [Actinoplanes sichuanensis]|nr:hypothetical protein Q0Z83_064680 [Actinoplanes sichuanensis]